MPKYTFACRICGNETLETRAVDLRNVPAICARCGSPVERTFSADFQLITEREVDKPENKYMLGFSDSDRLATMKADDRAYESNWAGAETGVSRVTPGEALAKTPLNALFPHV